VDARMQQSSAYPQLNVDTDRSRIAQVGLTQQDVTSAIATSLAGTSTTAPAFFLNPKNGVSYNITAQTPEYQMDSLQALQNLPVTDSADGASQVLGGVAHFSRSAGSSVVTHYNILPTIDLYATAQDRDLGAVAKDVQRVIDANMKYLPRGATVALRGQVVTMNTAFSGLFYGLLAAVVLIYLLIVVNFQSLTGAIMCMGVATANSILVIAFARERLNHHGDAVLAALEAGFTRFRPVLMTALAMVIGMLPMALGLGEGGEQNAPLGRAVIGGLVFATCATLLFVPVVFSIIHGRRAASAAAKGPQNPPHGAGGSYAR